MFLRHQADLRTILRSKDLSFTPYVHNHIDYILVLITPSKGGDPAAGSPTATLLRLHPNYPPHLRHPPQLS